MQLQLKNKDFNDPFNAGQMVGMLVVVSFIEKNGGITSDIMNQIKQICSLNVEQFLNKPSEDILLMVENMVKEINLQ